MNITLVMGSSRSGTTLLLFLCEAHKDIACSGDLDALANLMDPSTLVAGKQAGLIPANHVLDSLPLVTSAKHRILTTRRDPVDIVASMSVLENDRTGTLLTTFVTQFVIRKIDTDSVFRHWMQREIDIVEAPNLGEDQRYAALGATHYKWIGKLTDRYEEMGYPVHRVVYEELVTDPELVLRNLCAFMGVDFHPNMLNHHTQPHPSNRIPGAKMLTGNNDPFKPIFSSSVGKGYTILTPAQIEIIQQVMAV